MFSGLENLFCGEFWRECVEVYRLFFCGNMPVDLFLVFNGMLLVALLIVSSPFLILGGVVYHFSQQ